MAGHTAPYTLMSVRPPSADRGRDGNAAASDVSSYSMTARGWQSALRQSRLENAVKSSSPSDRGHRSAQPAYVTEIEQVRPNQGA